MPIAVALKKVEINSGYIEYKERSNQTGNSGKIRFHNIALSITNFSNRPQDLAVNPVCGLHLRAKFLNEIPVNINLRLFTQDEKGKFTADGNIEGADATVFNQIIQPMGMANIESGKLNHCEFHLQGNDYGATGTVTVLYNDLKVNLLEKDQEDGQYKSRKLASLLANVAIKNDNPKKNKSIRVARVNYKRDVYKSFFNLVWKSIFSGISETVGIEVKDAKMDTQ
jgi:hypothetical protein